MEKYCPVIGIDLGTTNSVVSVWDGNENVVIRSYQHGSHKLIPSFVAFEKGTGDRLVGWPAWSQWERNPVNTIFSAKRLIGRQFDDPTVEETIKKLPFKVINQGNSPVFEVEGPEGMMIQTPEQIGSAILSELKSMASDMMRIDVQDAVITVPAYFNSVQREATRTAGRIAGLNVRNIINEPTAAALAYGLMAEKGKEKLICIFDLGGGTFDVTVMQVKSNGDFAVQATGGDSHLGGDDFDDRLMDHFIKEWDLADDLSPYDKQRLRKCCRETKEALSDHAEYSIELDGFADGTYEIRITRAKFEALCRDLFKKAIDSLEQVLKEAKVKRDQIDDVVLVGGSCKMRRVQHMIKDFFKKDPYTNINPDEVVAMGASCRAAHLYAQDDSVDLWDDKGSKPNIGQVTDVIPLSLGVGIAGDALSIILSKNTPIPHDRPLTKSMKYKTITDNQELARWKIYQGENEKASKNFKLGQIAISNIPKKPKGEVSVQVSFSFDPQDGILSIKAFVLGYPEKKTSTSIEKPCSIPESQVIQMTNDEKKMVQKEKDRKVRNLKLAELQELAQVIMENDEFEDPAIREAARDVFEWCEDNDWAEIPAIEMQKDELLSLAGVGDDMEAEEEAPC
eukprot:TRINITY_DN9216_c0_g1_i1.p1 TRINITY_DN9216_c0_g1~~TRINITY_DN9216_c0_g1_i1.p1  ORF type:complete len:622 (+),score=160.23 TRINITY_DN9216_c0_g1_i1:53-1918(+)